MADLASEVLGIVNIDVNALLSLGYLRLLLAL
jgi:hypothetical protein